MPKLLMLKGLPASGKSTYARTLADKGWLRVNKDDLRAMLNNSKWSKSNENVVLSTRDSIINMGLTTGRDVVVDDTNLHPKHSDALKAIAEAHNATFQEKFFEISVEEAIKRDLGRERSVGAKVIKDMYDQFLKPEPESYSPDWRLPMAVICDIDGTLAHMKNRSPYDYSKVSDDELDIRIAQIIDTFEEKGYTIILVSGRDGSCRPDTEAWLARWEVPYKNLYMRTEGDARNDAIVKRELFDEHIRDKYQVLCVLDDRNRVVDMWRDLGLKCLQVAPGDF